VCSSTSNESQKERERERGKGKEKGTRAGKEARGICGIRTDDKSSSATTTSDRCRGKQRKTERRETGTFSVPLPVINVPPPDQSDRKDLAPAFTARLNLIPLVRFVSRPRALLSRARPFVPTAERAPFANLSLLFRVYTSGRAETRLRNISNFIQTVCEMDAGLRVPIT